MPIARGSTSGFVLVDYELTANRSWPLLKNAHVAILSEAETPRKYWIHSTKQNRPTWSPAEKRKQGILQERIYRRTKNLNFDHPLPYT